MQTVNDEIIMNIEQKKKRKIKLTRHEQYMKRKNKIVE